MNTDPLATLDAGHTPEKMGAKLPASHYPPRLVLVHPARWSWYDRAENVDGTRGAWLPLIGSVPGVPGVGNCGTEGDLGTKMMPARTQVARDGWIVCELNEWGERYLHAVDGDGGSAYLYAWQRLGSVGGNVRVVCDEPVFYQWLRRFAEKMDLVDEGTVAGKIAEATSIAIAEATAAQSNPMLAHVAVTAATRVQRMRAGAGLPPDATFARIAPEAPNAPMVTTPAPDAPKPTGRRSR